MGSPCQWVTLTTEEVALPNHPQGRTPVIPILPGNRHDRPVTLGAGVAVMGIVVEGARSSAEGLVDQEDPEDLEEGTQTRTVIRATAQLQFTEAGMSWVADSHSAS